MLNSCKTPASIVEEKHPSPKPVIDTLWLEPIVETIDTNIVAGDTTTVIARAEQPRQSLDDSTSLRLAHNGRNDTVPKTVKPVRAPKKKESPFEVKVIRTAVDSVIQDVKEKVIHYYGNAVVKYDDITLEANYLKFDLNTNIVTATGLPDSTGKILGSPKFSQGETKFEAAEMSYNFQSKKGIIHKVWTEESGGYIHGEKIKRMDDNTINIRAGGFTTCNLKDHPHYQFRFNKAKIIPDDMIVTGPVYVTIMDVPLPIGLPFAMFPNTKGQKSGIIVPTYGESDNRGFYLENGGYYWAINEHYDLQLLGDIYTRGSWAIKPTFRYNQRYKHNGSLALGFAVNKIGDEGAADYNKSTDFKVKWTHKQDSKAHPRHSFSADVNIVSSNFNKYNATTTNEQLSNTFKSSIAYQTSFAGKAYLTLNASHSQNTLTRQVTASLPEVTFTVNQFYPLKKVGKVGKKRWYQDLNVKYTLNGKIYVNDIDTVLFEGFSDNFGQWAKNVFRDHAQMGVKHTVPVSLPIKLFKHFTWTNSATFNDYMYFTRMEKQWVADTDTTGHLQTDTIFGFRNLVDFNLSSNLTTKVYGMLNFAKGPIRAIRHVVTPTVGFTYKPNFGDPKWNVYKSYIDGDGNEQVYNMFANGIFGSPSQNQSGLVTYSINNTLDMKVPSKSDTITGIKKIALLEALNISGNYDVAKDSLRFSTVALSARTTLFKKLKINYNSAWDPYAADSLGRRINKFELLENGRLFHKNNSTWQFSVGYSFTQNDLDKLKGKKKDTPPDFRTDIQNRAQQSMNVTEDELDDIMGNPNAYIDWNTPWSVTLSYNLSYTTNITYAALMGIATNRVTNTLGINGDISLTPNWKVTFTTGWDFTNKGLSNTNLSVYRDLHCWEMRFSWTPIGYYKSWNFTINVKASALKDLKLTKKKDYRDN